MLDAVSLELVSGEAVALIGPSGAGKTTLLSVIAGSRRPDAGARTLSEERDDVAWIFQTSPVLMHRDALDNVALGPLCRGVESGPARERARRVLGQLGMGDLAGQRVHRLSGGERQRVAIARALASDAALVVADEPSASLDAANRTTVCDALLTVAAAGALVVVATHDQAVADRMHRVTRLDGGRVTSS